MRIIGNIDHPVLKITIFKMDNKLSVKFETGLYEQTYKFRMGDLIKSAEDIRTIVDQKFLEEVLDNFNRMTRSKNTSIDRNLAKLDEEEFDDII